MAAMDTASRRRRIVASPGRWITWALVAFFFVNLVALIATVVIDSVATKWFGSWLPPSFTLHWYSDAWQEFQLGAVLRVTLEVAIAVVVISVVVGVPAAYAMARRDFPGKRLVMMLFLLPVLLPPLTYGIPLATVLYKFHLAGTLAGVTLANLVPAVPFVVLTMTPFIEQIDRSIESAARMCGARTSAVMLRVITPLLLPGVLAASILVLVRTVGMFELTFLTVADSTPTLIVNLYYAVFSAGIRAQQSVDAMAVIYTLFMLALLVVALRFINPTQLVTRVREDEVR